MGSVTAGARALVARRSDSRSRVRALDRCDSGRADGASEWSWSQGRVEVLRRSCAACLERAGLVVRIAQTRVAYPPHPRRALRARPSAGVPAGGSPPEDTGRVSWTV